MKSKNIKITRKFQDLKFQGEELSISCITYYEVKRGLLAVNATRQLSNFNEVCQELTVIFLDSLEIIERASTIYADLKQRGRIIQDADILIAATAITKNLTLVSDDSDMLRIPGLTVENWLRTSL